MFVNYPDDTAMSSQSNHWVTSIVTKILFATYIDGSRPYLVALSVRISRPDWLTGSPAPAPPE